MYINCVIKSKYCVKKGNKKMGKRVYIIDLVA